MKKRDTSAPSTLLSAPNHEDELRARLCEIVAEMSEGDSLVAIGSLSELAQRFDLETHG